jgi:predicted nucleic acid-binding protein
MAGKKEVKASAPPSESELGIYVDSSALAKLYVPEAESERLDRFLQGRRDLMISELSVTEVLSAVARRRREGALDVEQAREIRDALLSDAVSGSFRRLDLSPAIHRQAERILLSAESVPLRTLDALHIALALSADASSVITFDDRLAEAAGLYGLQLVQL